MNLKLCLVKDERLYNQMSVRFSKMSRISLDDCKLVLKLITEATKEAADRKGHPSTTNVLYDDDTWFRLCSQCDSLSDITRMITDNDNISSLYSVIELMFHVAGLENTLSTDQTEGFLEELEKLQQRKALQRVSKQYIDMLITALKFSRVDWRYHFRTEECRRQVIDLLEKIRNSEKLTSDYDNIRLLGKDITRSNIFIKMKTLLEIGSNEKRVYKMKHPRVTDCKKEGDCGFVILNPVFLIRPFGPEFKDKFELSRVAGDYTHSGVHLHEEFRVEDMNLYSIATSTTTAGDTVRYPQRRGFWGGPWGSISPDKESEFCIDYNIEDYLVAKY